MKSSKLLLMALFHFIIMFILMYSMIDSFDHFYFNINKIYMAGIMTAPMLVIEIFLMGSMYKDKQNLTLIMIASIAVLVFFFSFIRKQTLVKDKQFLKSMIPHHSSAILMCEKASITDPEIEDLCKQIIEAQKREIDIMQEKLESYK